MKWTSCALPLLSIINHTEIGCETITKMKLKETKKTEMQNKNASKENGRMKLSI